MGVGRFICVALPFGLTLCSLICILLTMTVGFVQRDVDMFAVDMRNLSISSSSLQNLENLVHLKRDPSPSDPFAHLTIEALNGGPSTTSSNNINLTASDLGLADTYKVSLWNYCYTTGTNTTCTKAKFNWAADALNATLIQEKATTSVNFTIPSSINSSLHTFATVTKWTEVVYIIALILCVAELIVGIFGFCFRAASCVTYLVSGLSTVSIIVASIMATVLSSITVGSIDASAKAFGVHSSINTFFLAITWLAAAFSIGGGMFWLLSACCCGVDHHARSSKKDRRGRGGDDAEKFIPSGAYQRVQEDTHYEGQQSGVYHGAFAVPTPNIKPMQQSGAYEPYSHAPV